MRRLAFALIAMLPCTPAAASLTSQQLAGAVARPPAGAHLPAGVGFVDANGRATTLGAAAAGKPLVLVFADYTCPHICGPGLTLTGAALHDSGLGAGRDYRVAVVGIDPKDSLADARAMGARIADPAVRGATTLLTGSPAAIAAATGALGYGYAYDPAADAYAHDASVYVFGGDGHLVTLLPEVGLNPVTLRAALANGAAPPPTIGERIAHLCYGLAAAHGRYGRPVVLAMQAMALAMLAAMAFFLFRRRRAS